MPPKPGSLGRGLGDLMGGLPRTIGSAATMSTTGFVRLQPGQVTLTPGQESRAAELPASFVESIGTHGVLQPVLVRRGAAGYELVAGARRVVAARQAGLPEIPAMIVTADDAQAAQFLQAENEQREHVGRAATGSPEPADGPLAIEPIDSASIAPGPSGRADEPLAAAPLGRWPSPWLLAAAALALILAALWAGFGMGRRSVPVSLAATQDLSLPPPFGDSHDGLPPPAASCDGSGRWAGNARVSRPSGLPATQGAGGQAHDENDWPASGDTGAHDLIPAPSPDGQSRLRHAAADQGSREAADSPGAKVDPAAFTALVDRGMKVEPEGTGVRLTFDAPLFTYRANLDSSQQELLKAVGSVLAVHSNDWSVVVTGHTDATPLRGSSPYRDNTELGLARASEVVRFLWREAGVPGRMVRVASAGDAAPLFPGDDPATQRRNRTATLRILPGSL